VRVSGDVVWSPLEGELVLYHASEERYFGLNEVGARIWRMLAEAAPVDEIVERLQAEYEVDPTTARSEVFRLLNELMEARLVVQE